MLTETWLHEWFVTLALMVLVKIQNNTPGAKYQGGVAPEALARRSKAVVSPHILVTNKPTDPSPCHQPQPSPFSPPFTLSSPLMSSVKVFTGAGTYRWFELISTGVSWGRSSTGRGGSPTTEAAPPGKPRHPPRTPSLPPSLPCLGKGGSWQTLHSTFAQSILSK